MIHFLGSSYAAVTLKEAARRRGLKLTDDINEAELIFVSEDTPTDENGKRDLQMIIDLTDNCKPFLDRNVPMIVTSQVPPRFMHNLHFGKAMVKETDNFPLFHQAETLRIEDGLQRAMYPEMFIVGCPLKDMKLPKAYQEYLDAFECPIIQMSYEEAEFCKIAINSFLISQVETTNMLSMIGESYGVDWGKIAQALRHDSRIGKYSYLTPGDWQKSKHLLRDYVTLLEKAKDASNGNRLLEAWR